MLFVSDLIEQKVNIGFSAHRGNYLPGAAKINIFSYFNITFVRLLYICQVKRLLKFYN